MKHNKNTGKIGCMTVLLVVAALVGYGTQRTDNAGIMMASGGMNLALFVMTVASLVWLFLDWNKKGILSAIPLILGILGFFMTFKASDIGREQKIAQFRNMLPQYEAFIQALKDGTLEAEPGVKANAWKRLPNNQESVWISLRNTPYKNLGYAVVAIRDADGTLTARFLRAVIFNGHHRKLVYRSDGDFEQALTEREFATVVNEHWRAVLD